MKVSSAPSSSFLFFALGLTVGVFFTLFLWAGADRIRQGRQAQEAAGAGRSPGSVRLLSGEAGRPARLPVRCVQEQEFTTGNALVVHLRTWTRLEAETAYHRAAMMKATADEGGLWNDVRRRAREASINDMLEILICYGPGGGDGQPPR